MIRHFKAIYGAGWRAGICEIPRYVPLPGGLKYIAGGDELCPFPARQFISRFFWLQGHCDGLRQRLMQPIKKGF